VQLPDTAAGGLFTCSTVPRPQLRGSPAGLHRAPQDVGRADPLAPARPYADEYALADFLRVSPWSGEALRTAVLRALLQTVTAIQAKTGWRLLFLSVDDSLCCKDIVAVHLQLGPLQFLLTWRLYLKHKQVKALNRQRRAQGLPLLTYHALPSLVQQMLDEIAPQLPAKCKVLSCSMPGMPVRSCSGSFAPTAGTLSAPPKPIAGWTLIRLPRGGTTWAISPSSG